MTFAQQRRILFLLHKQNFQLHLVLCSLTMFMAVTESSSACPLDPGLVKPSTPLVSFLERLQEAAFNTLGQSEFDPKPYVDLPLKFNLSVTEEAFDKLVRSANGPVPVKELNSFIETYMDGAGDDVEYWEPQDFVGEPEGFLPKVEHPEVRAWALKVHSLWKNLSRRVARGVKTHPQLHTLLPLSTSFVIPGSRFREVYYWDSYWVIRFVSYSCLCFQFHTS